ncbi:MAG: hypothetical protein A2882_16310 [Phenylobacterium sp. RIFCSPHIGHO2_01_FULL_70_10]|nr:MAG: hypothetical protein A2882_16310 [Phenylobacterium sp. RIFCSPHIGHO2_01_FULL_70_10]
MKRTPHVTEALVKDLEARFPDRCPDPKMSDREVWMAVGAVKVVRYLRSVLEDRQQNPLEDED